MSRVSIRITGGRGEHENAPASRGQDIGVIVLVDGKRYRLPCTGLVLRCDGRKAIATVNLMVDEVELTAIERVDAIEIVPVKP